MISDSIKARPGIPDAKNFVDGLQNNEDAEFMAARNLSVGCTKSKCLASGGRQILTTWRPPQ
jgi:hypothetical protein